MSIGYGVLGVLGLLLRRLSVELLDEFLRGADCSFCVAMSYKILSTSRRIRTFVGQS